MSNLTVKGNALGSGTVTLESPNTNSTQTVTLPDATTTLVGTDATQTLTNKTIQGGALTLMTAVASTSGTAIDFTGIPSWVKRVTVMLTGTSLSGTSYPQLQLGDSGGVETSGYAGYSVTNYGAGGSALIASSSGFPVYDNTRSATTSVWTGAFTLTAFGSNQWLCTGAFSDSDGSGAVTTTAGSKVLSDVLDRIRLASFNGTDTFDAGSINVMYEG
jgi:hypothetical protein